MSRVLCLWIQFSIPIEFNEQKRAIRGLKPWIQGLEKDNKILGFAFNHYFDEKGQDLRLRFDISNENLIKDIESELRNKLLDLNIETKIDQDFWNDYPEYVRRAYEAGSRMTFLFFELLDNGRLNENYLAEDRNGLYVQRFLNHGLMNSLGIPKYPNEAFIHLALLKETLIQRFGTEIFNLAPEYIPIPIGFKDWIQKLFQD